MRKLLQYPNRPAVIYMHFWSPSMNQGQRSFWHAPGPAARPPKPARPTPRHAAPRRRPRLRTHAQGLSDRAPFVLRSCESLPRAEHTSAQTLPGVTPADPTESRGQG